MEQGGGQLKTNPKIKRIKNKLPHRVAYRYFYKKFKRYALWPTWRLVFTAVLFLFASLFMLRANNIKALEKYREVIKADQNNGNVYEKLNDLQYFTFSHLNSDLGRPVQLVETYNRDAEAIFKEAQARLNESGTERNVYLEAQNACEKRGVPSTARAQCAANYVLENNPDVEPKDLEVVLPDKELYSFRFSSPRWTWDAAGTFLFLAALFFGGMIFRMILAWYLRRRWANWDDKYLRN